MEICWNTLEDLSFSKKTGKWFKLSDNNNYIYFKYIDRCNNCSKDFLIEHTKKGTFCSNACFHSYGRDEKYRKNISKAKKGSIPWNKGIPRTREEKRKMSSNRRGKGTGLRPKQSLKMMGSNNPNWNGGKSREEYCDIWYSSDIKEMIKERDNYECRNSLCWKNSNTLCVHHINYNKQKCYPENLITTCRSCNARANFNRDFWKKHYKNILLGGK